jgi:hypothetical protein
MAFSFCHNFIFQPYFQPRLEIWGEKRLGCVFVPSNGLGVVELFGGDARPPAGTAERGGMTPHP